MIDLHNPFLENSFLIRDWILFICENVDIDSAGVASIFIVYYDIKIVEN